MKHYLAILLFLPFFSFAQNNSANNYTKQKFRIIKEGEIIGISTDKNIVLQGNVIIEIGSHIISCSRLGWDSSVTDLNAYDVTISSLSSCIKISAGYLFYDYSTAQNKCTLTGNITISSNSNDTIRASELKFDFL